MADVLTRSFAHMRRRTESVDTPITPANELTSWLGDDMCANCGSAVQGTQLYCSDACRAADAHDAPAAAAALASVSAFARTQCLPEEELGAERTSSSAPAFSPRQPYTDAEGKFRYPCPPSPHLLAKYKAAALTSPALTALERSLPSRHEHAAGDGISASSLSDESSSVEPRRAGSSTKRRSSSRSTFSSADTDNFSTVPSTPSPSSAAVHDDFEDLEPSALALPPSVKPASTVLLKSVSRDGSRAVSGESSNSNNSSTSSTPSAAPPHVSSSLRRSPAAKPISPPTSGSASSTATMRYARRPSSTNLPPPVLFTSPALTATHRINARGAATVSPRQQATLTRKTALGAAKRPSVSTNTYSSPAVLTEAGSPSKKAAGAMPMASKERSSRGYHSPEQIASAASSAGKTLRAFSPASLASPVTTVVDSYCGRPGCLGASSSREALVSPVAGTGVPISPSRGRSARRPSLSSGSSRPGSRDHGHQHTHSARGGLSMHSHFEAARQPQPVGAAAAAATVAAKGLIMTPAIAPADRKPRRSLAESPPPMKNSVDDHAEPSSSPDDDVAPVRSRRASSPPRGRSKARGRSSTSRRSPSPPRAAARRGTSEGLSTASSTASLQRSASPSRPAPIPIASPDSHDESEDEAAKAAKLAAAAALRANVRRADEGPSPMALRSEQEQEREERSRRGRSPTERGERGRSRGRSRAPVVEDTRSAERPVGRSVERAAPVDKELKVWTSSCEVAWPGYGHDTSPSASVVLNKSAPRTSLPSVIDEAPGYDDVDLELDD